MNHVDLAVELFFKGYNCAQAIAVAFSDVTGLDKDFSSKMICSFGAGMGRMREVCGAVSGMLQVAGLLYGYESPEDNQGKKEHYHRVQELAGAFRREIGSIICRDILKNPPSDPTPSERTAQYYKERPCAHMVATAAKILDDYIENHAIQNKEI